MTGVILLLPCTPSWLGQRQLNLLYIFLKVLPITGHEGPEEE
jgi:hypothetical protein